MINFRHKKWYAHRLAWTFQFGEIPDGMFVCHKCDNPCCINPDHMFLGDDAANHTDKQLKGRAAKKLTEDQVRAIKVDNRIHREIALDHGIDGSMVSKIKRGVWWSHII